MYVILYFRIRLHAADVHLQRNSELLLSGVRDARITNRHLKAVSSMGEHSARNIGTCTVLVLISLQKKKPRAGVIGL